MYLALVTNRTLIIPNLLGNEERIHTVPLYRGLALWPGFRVVREKKDSEEKLGVKILEPSFYWRVKKDYATPGGDDRR